jgi:hypothetical protein
VVLPGFALVRGTGTEQCKLENLLILHSRRGRATHDSHDATSRLRHLNAPSISLPMEDLTAPLQHAEEPFAASIQLISDGLNVRELKNGEIQLHHENRAGGGRSDTRQILGEVTKIHCRPSTIDGHALQEASIVIEA